MCELCGKEEETSCHLFWFCDHARGVWTSSKLVLQFEISRSWNFLDVVENLQRREQSYPGLLEKVIMVCWSIWKNRNALQLGGKGKAGRSLVRGALYLEGESGSGSGEVKKLKLYSFRWSTCSFRVRIALNFKRLKYEYKSVNLSKGEQFIPGGTKTSKF
ncbi:glutathione s-transferase zeta class [Quercus suber]|uniref:Glutathione s-transferase zeta class n=1 Tax=Quercus suber TaxID=58331 RepID=A0AAW0IU46_QUESU